jgi:hypothetical protein
MAADDGLEALGGAPGVLGDALDAARIVNVFAFVSTRTNSPLATSFASAADGICRAGGVAGGCVDGGCEDGGCDTAGGWDDGGCCAGACAAVNVVRLANARVVASAMVKFRMNVFLLGPEAATQVPSTRYLRCD